MNPYQYACTIEELFKLSEEEIIGCLTINNGFDTGRKTVESWKAELATLKLALKSYEKENGFIAFEYTIPRVDGRIDCVVGLRGILFVLEFKTGDAQDEDADKQQLEQYVYDLKNFHFESYDLPIVPLWVVPQAELPVPTIHVPTKQNMVFNILTVSDGTISKVFDKIFEKDIETAEIDANNWLLSPYCPTSNIIEAARKLYASHKVEDINRSDAKGEDPRLFHLR